MNKRLAYIDDLKILEDLKPLPTNEEIKFITCGIAPGA